MYIISVITTSPFYSGTHLFTHPLPPHKGSQCWLAFSAIIKVYFQSKGWVAIADCQLVTFSYFYLIVPPVNIINLVHTCLRTHDANRGGQYSMFMSENTRALVDLFDKAVSCQEGARANTVKTRSQPYDETQKCRFDVTRCQRMKCSL